MVPGWQRVYLAACAGVIGFALAYALCDYAGWPRLTYDPIAGEVQLARPPLPHIQLGYLGLVAWGVGGALVAGGGVYLASRALRRPVSERLLRLTGAWALTAIALAGLFETWNLWPW